MKIKISKAEEKICAKASFALAEACAKGGFSLDAKLWVRASSLMGAINRYINEHRNEEKRA